MAKASAVNNFVPTLSDSTSRIVATPEYTKNVNR